MKYHGAILVKCHNGKHGYMVYVGNGEYACPHCGEVFTDPDYGSEEDGEDEE